MKNFLASKLLITIGVAFYLLVIPPLEWNQSHVFNADWPPHARFHEVWQLATNIMLGLLVLWLTWQRDKITIAAMISLCVMGGVILSHSLSNHIGGSIQSGNISKQILGVDLALFTALVVCVISVLAILLHRRAGDKKRSLL